MYTVGYNGVQIRKKKYFLKRCTIFPLFYIGMCTVYIVHFFCTHYDLKMLAALSLSQACSRKKNNRSQQ